MLAIDPVLFPAVQGSTDTEVVFHLALTHGLEQDPIGALEQTVGFIEATARERGLAPLVQGTFGVSDGTCLWAVRYATEGPPRSLFATTNVDTIKRLYPDNPRVERLSRTTASWSPSPSRTSPGYGRRSRRARL
jgi:glutamine amidotransferase